LNQKSNKEFDYYNSSSINTNKELYMAQVESTTHSKQVKDLLKTLGDLGLTNFEKNEEMVKSNPGRDIDYLIDLITK
jgi:hypothetical protein